MKREQIIEILNSYRIWFGDSMAIHEDAFCNLTDDILTLESKQIEKYKELIKTYSKVCTYLVNYESLTPKGVNSLEELSKKIEQLKIELKL